MSIAFADRFPESLLNSLFESDRESNGSPTLLPEHREQALRWLRRSLIDFDSLDQHIGQLQRLYQSRFRYPRPRRDRGNLQLPVEPPQDSAFRHAGTLPDEKVTAILDKGVDGLSNDELARLLLNPRALFDLFDCIDELQPDYWIEAIHDFVTRRKGPRNGGSSTRGR